MFKKLKNKKIIFMIIIVFIVFSKFYFILFSTRNISTKKERVIQKFHVSISKTIVNSHNFNYLILQDQICKNEDILLIAFVTISPANSYQRNIIRQTWANKELFQHIKTVFLCGISPNNTVNKILKEESDKYNDIIQENFLDTYENLTLKTIMGLKWVSEYCSSAKFVLKIDDDVVVNTPILINYLKTMIQNKKTNLQYFGQYMVNAKVIRNLDSRWGVEYNEYNSTYYPPYQRGLAYMISNDLTKILYIKSLYTNLFKLEDVYVGMLISQIKNINADDLSDYYFYDPLLNFPKLTKNDKLFASVSNISEYMMIWENFTKLNKMNFN